MGGSVLTYASKGDVGHAFQGHGVHLELVVFAADGALEGSMLPRGLDHSLHTVEEWRVERGQ
jgi:hypothetical protein